MLPGRRGGAGGARPRRRRAQVSQLSRLAARRRPDDGAKPHALRARSGRRHAGGRGIGRLRRDVGCVAALLQHADRRVAPGCRRLPHRRRSQGDQVFQRLVAVRRRRRARPSRIIFRAAAESTCASSPTIATAPMHSASPARATASIPPTASCRTHRAIQSSSCVGITQALSRDVDRQFQYHLLARPRLLRRSLQDVRPPAVRAQRLRVAHPLQRIFRRRRTRRCVSPTGS